MPTYGPKCKTCGHPIRMLVGREWRDIPCACDGNPPYLHTGPGPAPWEKHDGVHYELVRRPPIARMIRDKMAAARIKRQSQ